MMSRREGQIIPIDGVLLPYQQGVVDYMGDLREGIKAIQLERRIYVKLTGIVGSKKAN